MYKQEDSYFEKPHSLSFPLNYCKLINTLLKLCPFYTGTKTNPTCFYSCKHITSIHCAKAL